LDRLIIILGGTIVKKFIIGVVLMIALAMLAYAAAPVRGTITAVDGNKITVELDNSKAVMKIGDKVKIENGGKDGKFSGGMQMKGC
jgi:hypothetical protein